MAEMYGALPADHEVVTVRELALFLGGDSTSFTGDLLRLIAKARNTPASFVPLQAAFPRHVLAWQLWEAAGSDSLTAKQLHCLIMLQAALGETAGPDDAGFYGPGPTSAPTATTGGATPDTAPTPTAEAGHEWAPEGAEVEHMAAPPGKHTWTREGAYFQVVQDVQFYYYTKAGAFLRVEHAPPVGWTVTVGGLQVQPPPGWGEAPARVLP